MFSLLAWIFVNSYVHAVRPFDPYPFINLVLLTFAALQAPVSLGGMHDYQVNLKAELEIRQLHQMLDHLLSHQWEGLVEIQDTQIEPINQVTGKR